MLFDTHTHIYLPEFDNDRDDVVHRALENGVTRLMLPNVDLDTIDALQHTLNAYPDMCSAAMGLHPTSVTENYRKDLDHICEIRDTNSYQAVGEIGIDLYWDKSYQKEQIDAFEMQIRYAAQRSLPVIIHCREALDSILPVLHKRLVGRAFENFRIGRFLHRHQRYRYFQKKLSTRDSFGNSSRPPLARNRRPLPCTCTL